MLKMVEIEIIECCVLVGQGRLQDAGSGWNVSQILQCHTQLITKMPIQKI